MELERNEVQAVIKVADLAPAIVELQDLTLALVGGGCGEVIFPN